MKRSAIIPLSLLMAVSLSSQNIVRNPATPLNPDAGRVLKLEPILAFDDSSGDFYIKAPTDMKVDSRRCLYVLDTQPVQLLKFSPEGKFLANLVRQGQGPGEIAAGSANASFLVYRDDVYLCDGQRKIVRFDKEGNFVSDIGVTSLRSFRLVAVSEEDYFVTNRIIGGAKTIGLVDVENELMFLSADGTISEKIAGFMTHYYRGNHRAGLGISLISAFDPAGPALYLGYRPEYEIQKVELAKRKIAAKITREYSRIKIPGEELEKLYEGFGIDPPKEEYRHDINGIYFCDGNLWVRTSTNVEGKGRLFDVFDPQGRYADSFFFSGPIGGFLPADEGFLFVMTENNEGSLIFRKFKILNGPKASSQP